MSDLGEASVARIGPAVVRLAPLVAGAIAFQAWTVRFELGADALVAAAFVAALVAVSLVDIEERRIPNTAVLPAAVAAAATVGILHPDRLAESLVAGAGAASFFFVPALVAPRLVGMGDSKLALLVGIVLGADVVNALLVAGLAAGGAAIVLLVRHGRAARGQAMPFGPFLSAGATLALLAGGGCLYP